MMRAKNLPEYWERTESLVQLRRRTSAACRTSSRRSSRIRSSPQPAGNTLDGIAGGTMGANHPISFCKDFQGGRSFYTGLGTTAAAFDADLQKHLKGAISWAAGQSDPQLLRLRRDRAEELPAGQGHPAAEPQRADRLRSAPGRPHHPDRPSRRRAPAQPDDRHHADHRQPRRHRRCRRRCASTPTPRTASTARRRPELRHQQVGVPLLRAADRHRRASCSTARSSRRPRRTRRSRTTRLGRRRGTSTSATSSSRASSSSRTPTVRAWT